MGKILDRLNGLMPARRRELEVRGDLAAAYLQSELRREVGTPGSRRNPSRPGEPPRRRTGRYQRTLYARRVAGGIVAGSTDPALLRALEGGTAKMAPRPHFGPTVERTRGKVLDILRGK